MDKRAWATEEAEGLRRDLRFASIPTKDILEDVCEFLEKLTNILRPVGDLPDPLFEDIQGLHQKALHELENWWR